MHGDKCIEICSIKPTTRSRSNGFQMHNHVPTGDGKREECEQVSAELCEVFPTLFTSVYMF